MLIGDCVSRGLGGVDLLEGEACLCFEKAECVVVGGQGSHACFLEALCGEVPQVDVLCCLDLSRGELVWEEGNLVCYGRADVEIWEEGLFPVVGLLIAVL